MNLRQQAQKVGQGPAARGCRALISIPDFSVFGPEVKMKNIELRLEFGESLDQSGITIIKTDHVRLGQIMTNLISNAIRFTAPSSVRRITVRLDVAFSPPTPGTCAAPPVGRHLPSENEDIPVWLYVAVSDTGPGLTPDESAVLFQQFSRGCLMLGYVLVEGPANAP
jgi:signal transduction histidine kinase